MSCRASSLLASSSASRVSATTGSRRGSDARSSSRRRLAPPAPSPRRPRRSRRVRLVTVRSLEPEADPPPGTAAVDDDYAAWKAARDDVTSEFKRSAAAAGREGDFVVGAKPLDEAMLSRLMLQLLQNHGRGVPAAALLDKVKPDMCLDGYKSVLVGVGRTRQWALAREIVDWVRAQGVEQGANRSEVLTSGWFVALCRRRVDDREWAAAVEVFEYMREFGATPSGECIEMFALVTDREAEMSEMDRAKCRSLARWLAGSDAGRALWHLSFGVPGMEKPEATPSKTVRIAMPSEEVDLYGDIEKLQEQFKDYLR